MNIENWQPVDTYDLPEGTPVLVWDGQYQTVADCIGDKDNRSWWLYQSYGYNAQSDGYNEGGQIYGVTHWKPLGPSPEQVSSMTKQWLGYEEKNER